MSDDKMEKASKLGNKPKSTNEKKLNQIKLEKTFFSQPDESDKLDLILESELFLFPNFYLSGQI